MKRILIIMVSMSILFLIAAQSGRLAASQEQQQSQIEESVVPKGNFINLFHAPGTGFKVISDEATQYINACCENRDEAIQLLRSNGFKVTIESEAEKVRGLNKHWKTTSDGYEEFVFGKRSPGLFRFWRIFTSYRVTLFIKDGKVARVYASVNATYP